MSKLCVVVPVYNHPFHIEEIVRGLGELLSERKIVLVNDGSNSICTLKLRELAEKFPEVSLIERDKNGGKGAAVKTGLVFAHENGYTHALQIDADGQHRLEDVAQLVELFRAHPSSMICGVPVYSNVPVVRFYARYLTHIWVWINTLSLDIKDSMCGFRVYPLNETIAILRSYKVGDRMDFDPEIVVRLHWAGTEVISCPVHVDYPAHGVSHFHGIRDNVLISWAHTRLFFGMLKRLPKLIARRVGRGG